MQLRLESPIIVQGELVAPRLEERPPEVVPPPPPVQQPSPIKEPPPQRQEPRPIRQEAQHQPKPDTGVALPVLAAQSEETGTEAADYVVADVPELNLGDEIPFGSKVGDTAVKDYVPPSAPVSAEPHAAGDGRDSEDPVEQDVVTTFMSGLRQRSAQFGSYPAMAKRQGQQGIVKILVRYDRTGDAYQITLKQSSGYKILDQQALFMVTQACKDFPLPPELIKKAFSITVPVSFKLQ